MCAYCSYKFWKGSRRILRYLLHQNPTKYILGPLNKNLIEVNVGRSSSLGPRKNKTAFAKRNNAALMSQIKHITTQQIANRQ